MLYKGSYSYWWVSKYAGLDRFEARKVMVEELKETGALVEIENIKHNVGQCYRCQTL